MTTTTTTTPISRTLADVLAVFPRQAETTIRNVADAAGMDYRDVAMQLRRAFSKGLVTNPEPGVYALTATGRKAEYTPRTYVYRGELKARMRKRGYASLKEVADRIGVSTSTVRNWASSGKVKSIRVGEGERPAMFVNVSSVIAYLGPDAGKVLVDV